MRTAQCSLTGVRLHCKNCSFDYDVVEVAMGGSGISRWDILETCQPRVKNSPQHCFRAICKSIPCELFVMYKFLLGQGLISLLTALFVRFC